MSGITQEQNGRVGKFMTEFWKENVKPYYNPPEQGQDEQYWKDVIEKTRVICEKYAQDDIVVRQLAMALVTALERVQKGQGNAETHEYMAKDDILDALNQLFKAQKQVDNAMKELQGAFKRAHRVELSNGSIMTAAAIISGQQKWEIITQK